MSFLRRLHQKLFRKKSYPINTAILNLIRKSVPEIITGELVGMQALPIPFDSKSKWKLKYRGASKYGGYKNKRYIRWRMRRTFIDQIEKAHLKSGWDQHLGCHANKITGDLVCVYEIGHRFMTGYYVKFSTFPKCIENDMSLADFLDKYKRTENQPESLEDFCWWMYA